MFLKKLKLNNFIKNTTIPTRFSSNPTVILSYDNTILVGGQFTNYKRKGINRLVSLRDDSFSINSAYDSKFSNSVLALARQSDGKILAGGQFTNYQLTNRNYLVRLNSDGTLDTAFCSNAVNGGKFGASISAITIQSDGKILVGGSFTNYGGFSGRNFLVRLNSDGTLDTTFCNNAVDGKMTSGGLTSIFVQSDDKILIGGAFTNYGAFTGRNRLVRLNSDGTLDTTFCNNAVDGSKVNGSVECITQQADGKLLLGGVFSSYGGFTGRDRLVRFNLDGTLDTTFCNNIVDGTKFNGNVLSIQIQSDNKILIGGAFTNYTVTNRNFLIRLNSDDTLDTTFCSNAVDGGKFNLSVIDTSIQLDGKILIGGLFTDYGGFTGRNRLVRFNSDGTLDTDFCNQNCDVGISSIFSSTSYTISEYLNKNIIIGGLFTNYKQTSRSSFIVLDENGEINSTFLSLNNIVYSSTLDASNGIIVGGSFLGIAGGTGRDRLIRYAFDGSIDSLFCNNAVDGSKFNGNVFKVQTQLDGKILIGGAFTDYGGLIGRSYLVRLNSDGTLDTDFCNNAVDGSKINGNVNAITIQSDGKILVGGGFTNYGAFTNRNRLIRLNSDGTLDTTFCNNAVDGNKVNGVVNAIGTQSNGTIIIGGNIGTYGGFGGRQFLVGLNSDGTLNSTFCSNAVDGSKFGNVVNAITVQSDDKILVGGVFTNYGGFTGRNRLIRLNSDGTPDTVFCNNASDGSKVNNTVNSIFESSSKDIYIAGTFTSYLCGKSSSRTADRFIKLDSTGISK